MLYFFSVFQCFCMSKKYLEWRTQTKIKKVLRLILEIKKTIPGTTPLVAIALIDMAVSMVCGKENFPFTSFINYLKCKWLSVATNREYKYHISFILFLLKSPTKIIKPLRPLLTPRMFMGSCFKHRIIVRYKIYILGNTYGKNAPTQEKRRRKWTRELRTRSQRRRSECSLLGIRFKEADKLE